MEIIIIGGLAILFNMLDSLTTWLIDRLPTNLRSEESNVFVKPWLEKYPLLTHAFKQILVIGIVVFLVASRGMESALLLMFLAIILGFVVINNSYIWIGRKSTKRKIYTPFYKACKLCHVPDSCMYFAWLLLAIPVSVVLGYALT